MPVNNPNPPGNVGVPHQTNLADPETQGNLGIGYDVDLALAAERREQNMTLWEAFKADKRLIMWTIGFSGTIIMEGYGLALITFFFGFDTFKKDFGTAVPVVNPDGSPRLDENGIPMITYEVGCFKAWHSRAVVC